MWNKSPVQVRCMIQDARGWYTGMTQRDGLGREVEGGFRIGNMCTHVADSCWCMAKPRQYCKVKKNFFLIVCFSVPTLLVSYLASTFIILLKQCLLICRNVVHKRKLAFCPWCKFQICFLTLLLFLCVYDETCFIDLKKLCLQFYQSFLYVLGLGIHRKSTSLRL